MKITQDQPLVYSENGYVKIDYSQLKPYRGKTILLQVELKSGQEIEEEMYVRHDIEPHPRNMLLLADGDYLENYQLAIREDI